MAEDQPGVIGGVDTHRDAHVAAALDTAGRLLVPVSLTQSEVMLDAVERYRTIGERQFDWVTI